MINRMVAKVPEALAGFVCVCMHTCAYANGKVYLSQAQKTLRRGKSSLLVGYSLKPYCGPVFLMFSALAGNSVLLHLQPRAETSTKDQVSVSVTSVRKKNARLDSSLWFSLTESRICQSDLNWYSIILSVVLCVRVYPKTKWWSLKLLISKAE